MRLLFLIILTGCIAVLSAIVLNAETEKRHLKEDLIELSNVRYGIFSVDEWKRVIASIISRKIEEFNLAGTNKKEMHKRISDLLTQIINEFEARYYDEKSHSIKGWIQGGIASLTGTFTQIKKDIPVITDQILEFMNNPENRNAIQSYIVEKIDTYMDETFSEIDYTQHNRILEAHGYLSRNDAITGLNGEIETRKTQLHPFVVCLFIAIFLAAVPLLFIKRFTKYEYLVYVIMCLVLLMSGLALPMIEIDARISNVSFSLLGESVIFADQVLYYKSKSILEVVTLMISQSRIDLFFVGILVLSFSVLFPISKLIATLLCLFHPKLKSQRAVQFMAFRTGKWSMADVMVVAIFMAYIGFSGIIGEQLKQLESIATNLDLLTTNQSCLLIGFYLFTAFVILSILLSYRLQRQLSLNHSATAYTAI